MNETNNEYIGEPVYQLQLSSGRWIDQSESQYNYKKAHESNTVRILYTTTPQPQPAQQVQWLPIESAPKDGTTILGYWIAAKHELAIHATKFHRGRWWSPTEDYPYSVPALWQPLPPAPQTKGQP